MEDEKANIYKTARIVINNGLLNFNSSFKINERFPGLLEMDENSRLIINGNFDFASGAHIILSKKCENYNCQWLY